MRDAKLDAIDVKLLSLLQADGRTSQHDLAEAVGLSSPATGERVRKLVDRGIIRGFHAVLEPKELGRDVTAFIAVAIDGSQHFPAFVANARAHAEVLECFAITGAGSHILKVRTATTSSLEALLAEIQSWPGVSGTTTSVVLSVGKETTELRLDETDVQ